MRTNFRPWAVAGIMVAGLLQTSGVLLAETAPVVHVNAVVKDGTVRLEAEGTAPFEYTTYRPNSTLFVVDISGVTVDVAGAGDAQVVDAGPVRSYRLIPYESGDKASTRLEVLLRTAVEPRIERENSTHLTLVIGNAGANASANLGAGATRSDVRTVDARAEVEAAAPAESISDVHLAQAGQRTVVDVTGSGHLKYHLMRLSHPDRLVLDFSGAHLRTAEKSIPSNLDPVRVIRLAQFRPEVARVVIDLRQSAPFSVSADGNSVKVEFMPVSDSQAPVERTTGATTVKTKAHAQGSGVSDGLAHNDSPLALPASLTQANAAMAMPTPGAATVFPVKAEIGATTPAAAAAASRAGAGVQAAQAASTGGYTGEPISVNLKDVDLRDFFRLIHEISGLNVVLDPGVKGSLTIVLDDVPWDQALDIVLQNNDLDKQLQGNVLRVATKDTIKKEAEQERDLAKAQAEAADVVTTTRVLSYAKSDDMVTTLKKFLSARGDVLSDSRSNTVIIRDIPAVIPVMDNLIRQLDRRTQQVEIEARVVSASRTFASDIGSQLAFAAGRGNTTVGGNGSVGTSPITRSAPPPLSVPGGSATSGYQMPLATALSAAAPTSGLSYLFTSANFALDYVISAAEQKG
ncbi:MAG: AMIN domain-containing protein, partial [Candidatus Acidiferrales bacterium]